MDRSIGVTWRGRARAPRRLSLAALAAGVLLLATAPVATGDTKLGHSGPIGKRSLNDTARHPGANCFYEDGDGRLGVAEIRVRPPRVFARNRTAGVDTQTVGWRAILQQTTDGGATWPETFSSPDYTASATDSTPAHFSAHTYAVPDDARVRVQIQTFWYTLGSPAHIEANANNRVDFYGRTHFIFLDVVHHSCGKLAGSL